MRTDQTSKLTAHAPSGEHGGGDPGLAPASSFARSAVTARALGHRRPLTQHRVAVPMACGVRPAPPCAVWRVTRISRSRGSLQAVSAALCASSAVVWASSALVSMSSALVSSSSTGWTGHLAQVVDPCLGGPEALAAPEPPWPRLPWRSARPARGIDLHKRRGTSSGSVVIQISQPMATTAGRRQPPPPR